MVKALAFTLKGISFSLSFVAIVTAKILVFCMSWCGHKALVTEDWAEKTIFILGFFLSYMVPLAIVFLLLFKLLWPLGEGGKGGFVTICIVFVPTAIMLPPISLIGEKEDLWEDFIKRPVGINLMKSIWGGAKWVG
jgi:hypothetical protein